MPSRFSLRRSCEACIKAKRKCDLQSPRCSRCTTRDLACGYANEPSTIAAAVPPTGSRDIIVPVRRLQPNLVIAARICKPTAGSKGQLQARGATTALSDVNKFWALMNEDWARDRIAVEPFAVDHLSIRDAALLGPPKTLTLDPATMRFAIAGLREFPRTAVQLGRSSFIHSDLVRHMRVDGLISAIISLGGFYATTDSDSARDQTRRTLTAKLDELCMHVTRRDSLETLLLATQAMVLSGIILYLGTAQHPAPFDPALSFQRQRHLNHLGDWAHQLWELAPWPMPDYLDPHSAWLFSESCRRTLIVSTVLRDVMSILDSGSFIFTGFVSVLPFDSQTEVWDKQAGSLSVIPTPRLMSYRQLVDVFEGGAFASRDPGPWVRLLLVVCRGYNRTIEQLGHDYESVCPLVDDPTYLHRGDQEWTIDPFRTPTSDWVPSAA